jgi:RTX calcium-binding nonapeptide repeat (4 copies)
MRRAAIALGAALAIVVAGAGPAHAGTATVTGAANANYTAATGERNDLTVTIAADSVTFDDAGAAVTAGRGCDPLDTHTARCYLRGDEPSVMIVAGDEDDVVRTVEQPGAAARLSVLAGAGDDHVQAAGSGALLDGEAGADTLEGGSGSDSLIGGPGADTITGGGGDDAITPDGEGAAPAPDTVDGGPGVDSVSYSERTTPVDVDLERPTGNGGAGENDTIRGIENVTSGAGSDHLRGDEQANYLSSSNADNDPKSQHDVIEGRGGDDRIEGSSGPDRLSGGRGDDAIDASFGGGDAISGGPGSDGIDLDDTRPRSLSCGSGDDLVNYPLPSLLIRPECETVQLDSLFFLVRTRLRAGGRGVRAVGISGLSSLGPEDLPCRVVARLLGPGRKGPLLGTGAVRLPHRDRAILNVHLTAAGRRLFADGARKPIRLALEGRESCSARDRATAGADTVLMLTR